MATLLRKYYDGSTWSGWGSGGGPPACCQASPANLTVRSSHPDIPNAGLDITTGHFSGDGRSQIVVAHLAEGTDSPFRIALYNIQDGFKPHRVAELDAGTAADAVYVSAGDLDGDGMDEIAVLWLSSVSHNTYYVQFYDVSTPGQAGASWRIQALGDPSGRLLPAVSHKEHWYHFDMTAGDLDGDGDEEIAIGGRTGATKPDPKIHPWYLRLQVLDADADGAPEEQMTWMRATYPGAEIELEAGNLDGDAGNGDEIVASLAGWASDGIEHMRNIIVWRKTNAQEWDVEWLAIQNVQQPFYVNRGQTDALAVGDFDRDLVDEIAFYYATCETGDCQQHLDVYHYVAAPVGGWPATLVPVATTQSPAPVWNGAELVAGSFTGEGLRVGPPSYRVQNRVDTLITRLNMPPKHRDLVKDAEGQYHLIESPAGECDPSPENPNCTHAKYASTEFTDSEQTVTTQHAYELSAGMEAEACAGSGVKGIAEVKACVRGSIDYTHGGNFEKSTTEITSTVFKSTVVAAGDDKVVYLGTPYGVWEYPVLSGADGDLSDEVFITIAFPLISATEFPATDGGYYCGACDETWYSAGTNPTMSGPTTRWARWPFRITIPTTIPPMTPRMATGLGARYRVKIYQAPLEAYRFLTQ